jgi:prevent-host-death family protein
MKKITAAAFQKNCLAILDEVESKGESVLITKRGKSIAVLTPAAAARQRDIFGFLVGKGRIVGDVVSPILTPEEWGSLY